MSQNRTPIITILEAETKLDPTKKDIYRQLKNKLSHPGDRVRIFDTFPCLLPSQEINLLFKRLDKILLELKSVQNSDGGAQLASIGDNLLIRELEKDIVKVGCVDLLNDDGYIKKEILLWLGWNVQLNKEQTTDILKAYVAAINQILLGKLGGIIDASVSTSFSALMRVITEHYAHWTEQVYNIFAHPETRKKWREKRVRLLSREERPHLFDDLPSLLTPIEIHALTTRFQHLIANENFEKIDTKKFIKDIATISCNTLLEDYQLKKNIYELLELEEYLKPENVCEVIIDHVFAVYQNIISANKTHMVSKANAFYDLNEQIMLNYIAWTVEVLKENKIIKDIKRLQNIGLGALGLIAVASLAGAGMLLFRNFPSSTDAFTLDLAPKSKP